MAPETYITKETKLQLLCHCHDNSYAAGPVLITTKIPRFHLTQGSSTPNHLMGRVKTMWEPCMFRARPSVSLKKVANSDIWFSQPWQQHSRCHFVSFVMCISGTKFEEHCCNISGDILNSVLYGFGGTICGIITFLICITQKHEYL